MDLSLTDSFQIPQIPRDVVDASFAERVQIGYFFSRNY